MLTTELRRTVVLSLAVLGLAAAAKPPDSPYSVLAKLSADLSQNDVAGALSAFDKSMKGYGQLEQNIGALVAQTTILSAIDVIEDNEKDGFDKLSADWFLTLTLQNDSTRTESRREQVSLEMRQISGKWKITAMSPLSILDAFHVV